MIAVLRGSVLLIEENNVILDVNGVGYQLQVTGAALQIVTRKADEVTLYTHLQMREDGIALYGFASHEERVLFQRIITVSGAGPKTALSILSAMSPNQFIGAIHEGDRIALTKILGVGKKTAERLILELKEVLTYAGAENDWDLEGDIPVTASRGVWYDAHQALLALGYTESEADTMLKSAQEFASETQDLQELLKVALTNYGRRGNK